MSMEYHEYRVPAPLDTVVECVWCLRTSGGGDLQRVMPDGCMELILHLGEAFAAVSTDGEPARQAGGLLIGMLTRPMTLQTPMAAVDTIGIRFRPGGAHALVAFPLAEIADGAVTLDDLSLIVVDKSGAVESASWGGRYSWHVNVQRSGAFAGRSAVW